MQVIMSAATPSSRQVMLVLKQHTLLKHTLRRWLFLVLALDASSCSIRFPFITISFRPCDTLLSFSRLVLPPALNLPFHYGLRLKRVIPSVHILLGICLSMPPIPHPLSGRFRACISPSLGLSLPHLSFRSSHYADVLSLSLFPGLLSPLQTLALHPPPPRARGEPAALHTTRLVARFPTHHINCQFSYSLVSSIIYFPFSASS